MKRSLIVILCVLLVTGAAAAQDETIDPALQQEMDSLENETRDIRELDGESVAREFPTRTEVIDYLRESIDKQLPLEEAERYQHFYVALGLLDPDVDLREVYLTLLGAQVAGFYDSDTKIMNVVPMSGEVEDDLSLTEQIVYVHEYTHALQDQFFGLNDLIETDEVTQHPDRSLATLSLVEGDATTVMNVYTEEMAARNPFAAFEILGEGLQAGNLFLPPDTPAILGRELIFPYEGGMNFVIALYREGGWEAVNAAYDNPPVTMEQVLHPQRYLDGDAPVDVLLEEDASSLDGNWTQIWNTRLGEWYLREHLATQIPREDAYEAAAGWGGDAFHVYYNDSTGDLAWIARFAWDTPADANEFVRAYEAYAEKAYGASEDYCREGDAGGLCIVRVGDEILVSQGTTLIEARALMGAQGLD